MAKVEFHLIYIDPTLSADWFFVAAERYWLRYRPTVITSLDFLSLLPTRRTVVLTTLARRDFAKKIADDLAKKFPSVIHDPLVYDFPAEMQITLDGRVNLFQRYGLPNDGIPKEPSN